MNTPSRFPKLSVGVLALGAALFALTLPGIGHAQAKTTLSFAAATFAESGRGDKLKVWVDKFNKSQSEIDVQPLSLPFSTLAKTVFTQMGGGAGPDLVRFDLIDFYAAAQAQRILPLDDEIKAGDYKLTDANKYLVVDGKRYGVPFEVSNYQLIYNPQLLKGGKPPATFDEFLAAAKAATGDQVFGFAYRATMAESNGFWQDLCNFVYGFGGRWSDGQGNLTINSPKVLEGVVAYKKMYDIGATPKGADAATYRRMFWEKKLAMEIDNGGVASTLAQQAPDLPLQAAPSPFPTRAQGLILAPLVINSNTKNKAAAVTFVKWMMQPDNQKDLQAILGAANVATVVERNPEDLKARPWLKVYDDQSPNSVPQLVEGFEARTPEIQQVILEQVLRVLQGGADPQAALDQAQRLVTTRVLRK